MGTDPLFWSKKCIYSTFCFTYVEVGIIFSIIFRSCHLKEMNCDIFFQKEIPFLKAKSYLDIFSISFDVLKSKFKWVVDELFYFKY